MAHRPHSVGRRHHRRLPNRSQSTQRRRDRTISIKLSPPRDIFTYAPFLPIPSTPQTNFVLSLQLGDNELELYGPTSIFRLAPRSPERRTFSDEISNGSTDAYRLLSQVNPVLDAEIDWARHLPQEVPLTRVEHDRCAHLLTDRRPSSAHN